MNTTKVGEKEKQPSFSNNYYDNSSMPAPSPIITATRIKDENVDTSYYTNPNKNMSAGKGKGKDIDTDIIYSNNNTTKQSYHLPPPNVDIESFLKSSLEKYNKKSSHNIAIFIEQSFRLFKTTPIFSINLSEIDILLLPFRNMMKIFNFRDEDYFHNNI